MTETRAPVEIPASTLIFPAGSDPYKDDDGDLRHFAVDVCWRGPRSDNGQGGWAVMHGGRDKQLSRAGKWAWPQRFQQHQYRWATREEALEMARAHVDTVTINGRTWREWQDYFAPKADQTGPASTTSTTKEHQ